VKTGLVTPGGASVRLSGTPTTVADAKTALTVLQGAT